MVSRYTIDIYSIMQHFAKNSLKLAKTKILPDQHHHIPRSDAAMPGAAIPSEKIRNFMQPSCRSALKSNTAGKLTLIPFNEST